MATAEKKKGGSGTAELVGSARNPVGSRTGGTRTSDLSASAAWAAAQHKSSTKARIIRALVAFGLLTNAVCVGITAWIAVENRDMLKSQLDYVVPVVRTCWTMRWLDEFFTHNINMAGATGQTVWVDRYYDNLYKFDDALATLAAVDDDLMRTFAAVDKDFQKVLDTENAAFANIRDGNYSVAQALVNSTGYQNAKKQLRTAIDAVLAGAEAESKNHEEQGRSFETISMTAVAITAAWTVVATVVLIYNENKRSRAYEHMASKADHELAREYRTVLEDMRSAFYERARLMNDQLKVIVRQRRFHPTAQEAYTGLAETLNSQADRLTRLYNVLSSRKVDDAAQEVADVLGGLVSYQKKVLAQPGGEDQETLLSKWATARDAYKEQQFPRLRSIVKEVISNPIVRNRVVFVRVALCEQPPRKAMETLLNHSELRCMRPLSNAFQAHLRETHTIENYDFIQHVLEYKQTMPSERPQLAQQIYARFLSDNAEAPVNLDSTTLRTLHETFTDPVAANSEPVQQGTVFDSAHKAILELLATNSWPQFSTNPQFRASVSESSSAELDLKGILKSLQSFIRDAKDNTQPWLDRAVRSAYYQVAQQIWEEAKSMFADSFAGRRRSVLLAEPPRARSIPGSVNEDPASAKSSIDETKGDVVVVDITPVPSRRGSEDPSVDPTQYPGGKAPTAEVFPSTTPPSLPLCIHLFMEAEQMFLVEAHRKLAEVRAREVVDVNHAEQRLTMHLRKLNSVRARWIQSIVEEAFEGSLTDGPEFSTTLGSAMTQGGLATGTPGTSTRTLLGSQDLHRSNTHGSTGSLLGRKERVTPVLVTALLRLELLAQLDEHLQEAHRAERELLERMRTLQPWIVPVEPSSKPVVGILRKSPATSQGPRAPSSVTTVSPMPSPALPAPRILSVHPTPPQQQRTIRAPSVDLAAAAAYQVPSVPGAISPVAEEPTPPAAAADGLVTPAATFLPTNTPSGTGADAGAGSGTGV